MDDNLAHKYEYRKELIGGKIVAMSPAASNHNRIAGNIFGIFWSYLRGKPCVPYGDGELVYLTAEDTFIPDFMIVCDRNKIKHDGIHGAPDLVVEILSPRASMRKVVCRNTGLSVLPKSPLKFIAITVMNLYFMMFILFMLTGCWNK